MSNTYKERQPGLFVSGIQGGVSGTNMTQILSGTVNIVCAGANASSVSACTATIANASEGDRIFLTAASLPQGFVLKSASMTAASTVTASFSNFTTANITSSALCTFHYLAITTA
jgi:hypothetical protein